MIDFTVAYDKLAQFETADEIADYLKNCGVKARKGNSHSCAISQWMRDQTGLNVITGYFSVEHRTNDDYHIEGRGTTPAMCNFAARFDCGAYPELVLEEG